MVSSHVEILYSFSNGFFEYWNFVLRLKDRSETELKVCTATRLRGAESSQQCLPTLMTGQVTAIHGPKGSNNNHNTNL